MTREYVIVGKLKVGVGIPEFNAAKGKRKIECTSPIFYRNGARWYYEEEGFTNSIDQCKKYKAKQSAEQVAENLNRNNRGILRLMNFNVKPVLTRSVVLNN